MWHSTAWCEANLNTIEFRDLLRELCVHRLDGFSRLCAAADVRLVGNYDQSEAGGLQPAATRDGIVEEPEFNLGCGGVRFARAHDLTVERAIAVEEDRRLQRAL